MKQSELIEVLKESLATKDTFLTLAIDGPSGSGKTTLAAAIAEEIPGTAIIHMDDLYRGWLLTLGSNLTRELLSIFEQIEEQGSAIYSKFDWDQNRISEPTEIKVERLLVLEGVGSAQEALDKFLDLRVWIEVPVDIGMQRAIERDGAQIAPHMELFLADQDAYFTAEQVRERSDFHLSGN